MIKIRNKQGRYPNLPDVRSYLMLPSLDKSESENVRREWNMHHSSIRILNNVGRYITRFHMNIIYNTI